MPKENQRFKGQVVLITGAAQGIGKAIAEAFSGEGATVIIADIQQSGEKLARDIRDHGRQALFVKTDLRKESDIVAVIEATMNNFDRLDIVVNNARPKLKLLPFSESFDEWDMVMDILLKAPALMVKHAVPHMLKSDGGSIVNIASVDAFFIALHQSAAYHVYTQQSKWKLLMEVW